MDYGCDIMGKKEITDLIRPMTDAMADNLMKMAFDGRSLP